MTRYDGKYNRNNDLGGLGCMAIGGLGIIWIFFAILAFAFHVAIALLVIWAVVHFVFHTHWLFFS